MNRRRPIFRFVAWRSLVRGICALSLVLAVFAHHPVSPGGGTALAVAGDQLSLCVPTPEDPGHPAKAAKDCEFCRLAATSLLPTPDRTTDVIYRIATGTDYFSASEAPGMPVFRPAAPLRGPPTA
jgi:hypothetical protein